MDAPALRELRDAAGEATVREHDPVAIDGARAGVTLAPASGEDLSALLSVCSRRALPVLVRCGGSRLGLGNRPAAFSAWLSTAELDAGCEVDGDEGVARANAATPLSALSAAAAEAGWLSPLEEMGSGSTVGGSLATAAAGPGALGLGRPRDVVLGLDVTLASGEPTRCGGRVVKNVSGYDLARLQVGALGTLGVLTGAWLRLRPRPEAERTLAVSLADDAAGVAIEAARRPGARAAAWLDAGLAGRLVPGAEAELLLVEFAGEAPVVEDFEVWLRSRGTLREAEGALDALRALENDPDAATLRFRIAAPPSTLAALRARLDAAGAQVATHPGLSRATAFFALAREDAALVDEAWRATRAACAAAGAHCVLESAPGWAKQGRDVFDASPETLPLMRALKSRFDPAGILNPGRFAGGL